METPAAGNNKKVPESSGPGQYDRCRPAAQSGFSRRTVIFAGAAIVFGPLMPRHSIAAPDGPLSFLTTVTGVHDGRSLRLGDGRDVVLPHILPPGPDRHAPMPDTTAIRHAARGLGDIVLGQSVRVDLLDPAQDRYGRLRADISGPGGDVATAMLRAGLARVFPEPDADPVRIAALIAAEDAGRLAAAGFWGQAVGGVAFTVQDAAQFGQLPDAGPVTDRFEIVHGTVRKVTRIGARDHLEFGDDWRVDFTAGLNPRVRRQLERDQIERGQIERKGDGTDGLSGQAVTLRGWVRDWNGPFMEIDQRCQLQLGQIRQDQITHPS